MTDKERIKIAVQVGDCTAISWEAPKTDNLLVACVIICLESGLHPICSSLLILPTKKVGLPRGKPTNYPTSRPAD